MGHIRRLTSSSHLTQAHSLGCIARCGKDQVIIDNTHSFKWGGSLLQLKGEFKMSLLPYAKVDHRW